jgi:hypothetical protein
MRHREVERIPGGGSRAATAVSGLRDAGATRRAQEWFTPGDPRGRSILLARGLLREQITNRDALRTRVLAAFVGVNTST